MHAAAGADEASAPPAPLSEDELRAELRSIRRLLED
jgi:hypothetical protein